MIKIEQPRLMHMSCNKVHVTFKSFSYSITVSLRTDLLLCGPDFRLYQMLQITCVASCDLLPFVVRPGQAMAGHKISVFFLLFLSKSGHGWVMHGFESLGWLLLLPRLSTDRYSITSYNKSFLALLPLPSLAR